MLVKVRYAEVVAAYIRLTNERIKKRARVESVVNLSHMGDDPYQKNAKRLL